MNARCGFGIPPCHPYQAFFISPATGTGIRLQDGRLSHDDALRLLRQSVQEICCRPPEQNGIRHKEISASSSVSWIRLMSYTSRRLFSCSIIFSISSENVIPGSRKLERAARTSSLTIFPDNNARCGIHGIGIADGKMCRYILYITGGLFPGHRTVQQGATWTGKYLRGGNPSRQD